MILYGDVYFVSPVDHYDTSTGIFNLMPDNGDFLPIDKFSAVPCWNGKIYNPKLSSIVDNEVVPRDCFLLKCRLHYDTIVAIKTQTTEFMSVEMFEYIEKKYPEAAKLIAIEAMNNLTMNTVNDLMITKVYAGRNPQEVFWLWPELEGQFVDVIF